MQQENVSQFHTNILQQRVRPLQKIQDNENREIIQNNETPGRQHSASDRYKSKQASERKNKDQAILDNLKLNIRTSNTKITEEMERLILATDEQDKKIQDVLGFQESRKRNVFDAKDKNEALSQKLQMTHRKKQELEERVFLNKKTCTKLQNYCIPVVVSLGNCEKAKEEIVCYHDFIREQIRTFEKSYQELKVQFANEDKHWKEKVLMEKKSREKNREIVLKVTAEMEQKIQEARTKSLKLQQKNETWKSRIKEETAMKDNLELKLKEELQEIKEKVGIAEQKNNELTHAKEELINSTKNLGTSLQDVTNEMELWKNKISLLQTTADETVQSKQVASTELELLKARVGALETENNEVDSKLSDNTNLKIELSAKLQQHELDFKDKESALEDVQDAIEMEEEDMKNLQTLLQTKQVEHEALKSEYKSTVLKLGEEIESEKQKLSTVISELQTEEKSASELLGRLKENETSISSMEQELTSLNKNVENNKNSAVELQVLSNEENEHNEKATEEMEIVETTLQKLQKSVAELNKVYEEFLLQATRDKVEAEQELKNAQRELQNGRSNYDWIIQQTMTCVEECKQNYAQHVEEKEAALTVCESEFCSLSKQVDEALAEKDRVSVIMKTKKGDLEDKAKMLEEELVMKRALNKPQATSTPQADPRIAPDALKFPHSILKSQKFQEIGSNKQVQFVGLSSDSDSSLEIRTLASHMKSASAQRIPALKSDCAMLGKRKQAQVPDKSENIVSPSRVNKKFFKSRSQPTTKM